MKIFEGKTLDEAIEIACKDLNLTKGEFHYIIKNERKDIDDNKPYVIETYLIDDVIEFATSYLVNAIKSIGIEINVTATKGEYDSIRLTINSERNPILIGRGGRTLRALNELVKVAVSNKFKRRYHILLDIGDYKDKRYSAIISLARRVAKEVARQHFDVKLDPMSNDERRIVHQVLTDFHDVKTESVGEGEKRAVVIKYVGSEEHAFQSSEIYYKEIISNNINHFHKHGNKHFNKKNENSLNDLLHNSNSDFLKDDKPSEEKEEIEVKEENKENKVDTSIDDLPSASITTPIVDKEALKDLTDLDTDDNKEDK